MKDLNTIPINVGFPVIMIEMAIGYLVIGLHTIPLLWLGFIILHPQYVMNTASIDHVDIEDR
jgi:putative Mn2+ efflux pump MntP